ncbi:hypothetical protein GCM10008014_36760 [Paenibacillus silvae]|uniref:Uncharacterized protein n=1 Tax=Paenibacillus silvae TaxID=1325358 RepID=A0ABQ1ZE82_9BACL|nr:hypothetical protein [Paenibacillus silvae]GGH61383.1 hypothetical protein GCM10008014_36760 [Paenibacillus silvae]
MSVSSSIEISLSESISGSTILNRLEEYGWSYNDHGMVTFLPVGDDEDYNWQRMNITITELLEVIHKKEERGEVIGVVMTWMDTNIGGTFLIRETGAFLMSPDINRKVLKLGNGSSSTDINWYITKLIPVFGSSFQSITYQEHV